MIWDASVISGDLICCDTTMDILERHMLANVKVLDKGKNVKLVFLVLIFPMNAW